MIADSERNDSTGDSKAIRRPRLRVGSSKSFLVLITLSSYSVSSVIVLSRHRTAPFRAATAEMGMIQNIRPPKLKLKGRALYRVMMLSCCIVS